MFSVVDIEWDSNGLESRRTLFRSPTEAACWAFIDARIKNPNRLVSENAERLFVFDKLGQMQIRGKVHGPLAETLPHFARS